MTNDRAAPSDDIVGQPAEGHTAPVWMTRFIAVMAILVAVGLAVDFSKSGFGWDTQVNCAAVDAHVEGLDPYFVKNLKNTVLSYPYLPVTLDVFRPLCAGGFLVARYRVIYLVLAVLCAFLLPRLGAARRHDAALRIIFVFGGFLGFECVVATGNFAMLGGLLTAVALRLLLRPVPTEGQGGAFASMLAGAAVLGLVTSFKLVFFPVLAALYFLPQPRRRKLALIAVAAGAFALPLVISASLYPDLFSSWLAAITGRIPGQHTPAGEANPSLMYLALVVADRFGLAASQAIVAVLYGLLAILLVLAPFAVSVWRMVGAETFAGKSLPLARFDRWLMDHPRAAMRLALLAMYAIYICAPRLKEYAFFELALYAAVLVVDLPAAALATVMAVAIVAPMLAISGNLFMGGFAQLATALVCFWILVSRQHGRDLVVRAAGIEPAQLLRAEGF